MTKKGHPHIAMVKIETTEIRQAFSDLVQRMERRKGQALEDWEFHELVNEWANVAYQLRSDRLKLKVPARG